HHQYLASLGIITLASAGFVMLLARWQRLRPFIGYLVCVVLVATLACLTWRQSRMYANVETLWRTTIARDPDSWFAHYNLGTYLADNNRIEEAISHFQTALNISPDFT